jgi:hypothetical protein
VQVHHYRSYDIVVVRPDIHEQAVLLACCCSDSLGLNALGTEIQRIPDSGKCGRWRRRLESQLTYRRRGVAYTPKDDEAAFDRALDYALRRLGLVRLEWWRLIRWLRPFVIATTTAATATKYQE